MIVFTPNEASFVKAYDGKNYNIWNSDAEELKTIRKKFRDANLQRQSYQCCYCRQTKLEDHGLVWDVEHVAPKSLHPRFLFESFNIAVSCKACNIAKSERNTLAGNPKKYPQDGTRFLIIHPHFDNYDDHIEIIKLGTQFIYRAKNSGKGKATYIACDLIRFDYSFVGWESFDSVMVKEVMKVFDSLDPETDCKTLKAMLPALVRMMTR